MAKAPNKDREAQVAAICGDLVDGLSLRQACAKQGRPDKATFLRWMETDEQLRDQYARAREAQAETYAAEIIEIVDTEPDAARARVRMDARRWVASKLLPKKYGDKVQVGGDPDGAPVQHVHVIERRIVRPTDPDR